MDTHSEKKDLIVVLALTSFFLVSMFALKWYDTKTGAIEQIGSKIGSSFRN